MTVIDVHRHVWDLAVRDRPRIVGADMDGCGMALARTLTAERAAAFGETAARTYRFTNRSRETETGAGQWR